MANISDVFMKIRYRKNGKFYNDDLLKDKDIFNFLNDTSYPGGDDERTILPQNKEKLIFRTYGRWNYWNRFDFENTDTTNELLELLKSKEIENVYFSYIDYEEGNAMKGIGIIELDIENKKIHRNGIYCNNYPSIELNELFSIYNKKSVNFEDEDEYEIMTQNMLEIEYEDFLEFLEKSEFIFEINDILKIRKEIINFFNKYWKNFKYTDCVEILSDICAESENKVIRNEKISLEKKSFFESLKKLINNIKKS